MSARQCGTAAATRHGTGIAAPVTLLTGSPRRFVTGDPATATLGDGVDAPRRHLCAKVTVSNCH
jgi:hypothetical protein